MHVMATVILQSHIEGWTLEMEMYFVTIVIDVQLLTRSKCWRVIKCMV